MVVPLLPLPSCVGTFRPLCNDAALLGAVEAALLAEGAAAAAPAWLALLLRGGGAPAVMEPSKFAHPVGTSMAHGNTEIVHPAV